MERQGKPIDGAAGKSQPAAERRENYTASYMAAGDSHGKGPPIKKIPSRNGRKWLLLLLVLGGIASYASRDALLPWLRKNSITAPLVAVVEEKIAVVIPPKKEQFPAGARSDHSGPAGGDTTFSGKGFGTVTPDDGSDSFRVVLPPEEEKK